MIWFACKQCGKRLKQPDGAGGSFVFCTCGQGNRVPWESTLAPEPAEDPVESPSKEPLEEEPRPYRRQREIVEHDPAYCWNHQEIPSANTCDDCGEHFCAACIVVLRGKTLCGPCKNFRLARLQRPPRASAMAIVALVLGILGGPLSLCLSSTGRMNGDSLSLFTLGVGAAGLLLPAVALLLALLALGEMNRNPRVGGRALAITGAVTAVVGIVWSLAMILVLTGKPLVE
jgi:hypothetical protein